MDEKQVGLESAEAFEESLEPDAGNRGGSGPSGDAGDDSSAPLRLLETHENMPAFDPKAEEAAAAGKTKPEAKSQPKPSQSKKTSEADGIDYERWVGKRLGHFKLLRFLGSGTMGVVFQARHTTLERLNALKVLRRQIKGQDRQDRVERFLLEAKSAAGIEHPSIAHVYEIAEHNGWWYIAMEFLEGGSLHELVRASGPLSPQRACLMTLDAARGLEAAHEAGVIHRDIKPANLMLNRRGRCKLVDFGLVKLDSVDNPFGWDDKQVVGTPLYVAPEVARAKGAQLASDIYSLGATLYAILCGEPPYRAKEVKEILRQHVESDIPDVRAKAPDVPESLAKLIQRTMTKDPTDRPTATQLAAALQGEVAHLHATDTPSATPGLPHLQTGSAIGSGVIPSITGSAGGSSIPPAGSASQTANHSQSEPPVVHRTHPLAAAGITAAVLLSAAGLWVVLANQAGTAPSTTTESPAASNPTARPPGASFTNTVGVRLVQVPAGSFQMGSPPTEPGRNSDERRVRVTISEPYEISATEITQAQWAAVMGDDYSPPAGLHPNEESGPRFLGDSFPAYVSWDEASEFCRLLSEKEGVLYRLPTEAEWEYAARAGAETPFVTGDELSPAEANIDLPPGAAGGEPKRRPMPVANYKPNAWGLYDMHGNVFEWCADFYAPYEIGPLIDPTGPISGETRVVRGGSWDTYPRVARLANRWSSYPSVRTDSLGFRIVCEPTEDPLDLPSFLPDRLMHETRTEPPALPLGLTALVEIDPALPSYTPEARIDMRLRSMGSDTMDRLIHLWETEFRTHHPDLECVHQGRGSGTAVSSLTEGVSHMGPMSRPMTDAESRSFQAEFGYPPTQLTVGLDALAVFVHPNNPIAHGGMRFRELDAVLSATRVRGFPTEVNTWGDLGVVGPYANAPINVYGRNTASGTYGLLRNRVLQGGQFKDDIVELIGSAEVVEAVAADPFGLGYSSIGYARADAIALPLADGAGETPVSPTAAAAASGRYPIARPLTLVFAFDPSEPAPEAMREFLRFVYSAEGQRLVAEAGFLPLTNKGAEAELRKIGLRP